MILLFEDLDENFEMVDSGTLDVDDFSDIVAQTEVEEELLVPFDVDRYLATVYRDPTPVFHPTLSCE